MVKKVSVIVPVYNLENYIGECIRSVINQETNFEYEILVADDGSTDGSRGILLHMAEQWPEKVIPIFADENKGLVANLKSLLESVTGEYIAYLDGDDVCLPGKLQTQVDYLDQNPSCAICYHESEVFDSESGMSKGLYTQDGYNFRYIPQKATISHLIRFGTFLQASAVMFRRHEKLDKVVDPFCSIIADFPMHMFNAFYARGSIDFIDVVLGRYRVHSASFGAQTSRSVERREKVLFELLHACENGRKLGVAERDIIKGKIHFQYAAALYFLRIGELKLFTRYIELASSSGWFFDEKHQYVFHHREDTKHLKQKYFMGEGE